VDVTKEIATLKIFGLQGVLALRTAVETVSASGKTADSIRFEIEQDANGNLTFRILGRAYFSTLETGRGPRKSSTYQQFDLNILEYMNARGIGAGLPDKKKKQLAKFLAYRINKEGDETFKKGGRIVYTPTLTRFVEELKRAITQDFRKMVITDIISKAKNTNGSND